MSLSRERVAAAKARADAATDGPWAIWHDLDYQGFKTVGDAESYQQILDTGEAEECQPTAHVYTDEDAEFIASAREDVPVMADALLRVLDLHHAVTGNPDRDRPWHEATWCAQGCDEWPCATVRAVTGDGSSSNTEKEGNRG